MAIECSLTQVDAAIAAVNQALASGMDWEDLRRMIGDEKRAGNPGERLAELWCC